MDKANDIITNIIKEVLTALYQPFGAAVLMAFVSMFVLRKGTRLEEGKPD